MTRITSSSNRSKRKTQKPVTKGQNPQRANRQKISQAKVTQATNGKPTGAASARVTMGRGMAPAAARAIRAAGTLAKAAKMAGPAGVAAAVMAPRKAADATMKGKPTSNPQGPKVPARLTQAGMDKGSFDNAFRMSRKAGKSTFTWRGKKYNTKQKGEK